MRQTKEHFYLKLNKFIAENNPSLSFDDEDKVSSILLFKDFMRRLNIWKNELDTRFVSFDKANLNLFLNINPSIIDDFERYDVYIEYIRGRYRDYSGRNFAYLFIYLFIYWELYKNSAEIDKYNYLEHPYESVIKIVARKNMVYKQEGVNVSNVTMRDFNKPFRLPSLDSNFLDFVDSKCKLVGSSGIPNQEEIDILWQEFHQVSQ